MVQVSDFHQLGDSLAVWQAYDHGLRSDLFATAIGTQSGVYLIDSIQLHDGSLEEWIGKRRPAGILIANTNHSRAAARVFPRFRNANFFRRARPAGDTVAIRLLM